MRQWSQALQTRIVHTVRAASGVSILGFAAYCLVGSWILTRGFGDDYGDALPVLIILSAGHLMNVITGPSYSVLSMSGHHSLLRRAYALSAVAVVLLLPVGSHLAGGIGLATVMALVIAGRELWLAHATLAKTGYRVTILAAVGHVEGRAKP